MSTLTILAT